MLLWISARFLHGRPHQRALLPTHSLSFFVALIFAVLAMDDADDDADYYEDMNEIDDLDVGDQLSIPDPTQAINERREQMYSDTNLAFCLAVQDFFMPNTVAAAPKTAIVTKSSRLQLPSLLRADLGMEMRSPVARAYNYSPLSMSLRLFIKLILTYSVKMQLVLELLGLDNDLREVPSISHTMF